MLDALDTSQVLTCIRAVCHQDQDVVLVLCRGQIICMSQAFQIKSEFLWCYFLYCFLRFHSTLIWDQFQVTYGVTCTFKS